MLFAIGNLKTLFSVSYPSCWATFQSCSRALTQSTDYLQIVGIVGGQAGVGVIGDALGRRWGLIQDAVIMQLGVVLLVASNGPGQAGWVVFYGIAQVGGQVCSCVWTSHVSSCGWQFIYGLGVGGEYPMTGQHSIPIPSISH